MQTTDHECADDYCDAHLTELRRDSGEADPDGRVKKADQGFASLLLVEEVLRSPDFIECVGFDPHNVMLTPARMTLIKTALPSFAPFCCFLGAACRERVLRKSRHPPVELEYERRLQALASEAPAPAKAAEGERSGEGAPWSNT